MRCLTRAGIARALRSLAQALCPAEPQEGLYELLCALATAPVEPLPVEVGEPRRPDGPFECARCNVHLACVEVWTPEQRRRGLKFVGTAVAAGQTYCAYHGGSTRHNDAGDAAVEQAVS